jgi:hypothetical protein
VQLPDLFERQLSIQQDVNRPVGIGLRGDLQLGACWLREAQLYVVRNHRFDTSSVASCTSWLTVASSPFSCVKVIQVFSSIRDKPSSLIRVVAVIDAASCGFLNVS